MAEKLAAARELVALVDELSTDEKAQLTRSLEDIVQGGPRTEVGVFNFKRMMSKLNQASQEFLYKLVVDVASETAKKALTGS